MWPMRKNVRKATIAKAGWYLEKIKHTNQRNTTEHSEVNSDIYG